MKIAIAIESGSSLMPPLIYKLIDESIERHKDHRRKNSCSERVLALRRLIKGYNNYDNKSLLETTKARRVLHPALEIRKTPNSNR